ncbi:hypothetical protein DMC30DRAFT_352041 [Rhodotorula diobovata]|uniref:Uncharacterized protein n=1 Tax=Rhodotorula diobovata TaxID=5288 RepID=A0A5C5FV50_9BASI|nr:hypothetical protein DMC30DRAFT_352041 [Rhodotorula diobovata]
MLLAYVASAIPLGVSNSSSSSDPHLDKRATVIADGTSLQSGTLGPGVDWQASGVLSEGCECLARRSEHPALVERASSELLPRQIARQRIDFLSRPNSVAGESWTYAWSYRLKAGVSSSDHFFHIMQLFSRVTGGYLFALDVLTLDDERGPLVRIVDSNAGRCSGSGCPSLPLSRFAGRTTRHELRVKWGEGGSFTYTITDSSSGARLLTYSRSGTSLPANGYVKTGLYRAVVPGATSATAYVGDFNFRKTAS